MSSSLVFTLKVCVICVCCGVCMHCASIEECPDRHGWHGIWKREKGADRGWRWSLWNLKISNVLESKPVFWKSRAQNTWQGFCGSKKLTYHLRQNEPRVQSIYTGILGNHWEKNPQSEHLDNLHSDFLYTLCWVMSSPQVYGRQWLPKRVKYHGKLLHYIIYFILVAFQSKLSSCQRWIKWYVIKSFNTTKVKESLKFLTEADVKWPFPKIKDPYINIVLLSSQPKTLIQAFWLSS